VDISPLARGRRLGDLREHGVLPEDGFSGRPEVAHVPPVNHSSRATPAA
jgi:hypothetical protein